MEVLNWIADHYVITIILFAIVFGSIGNVWRWRR